MNNDTTKKNFTTGTTATGSKLGEEAKEKWGLPDGTEDDETVAIASEIKVPKHE